MNYARTRMTQRTASFLTILLAFSAFTASCKMAPEAESRVGRTKIHPADQFTSQDKLGVAFSGGGTRSMVASMGQMRALRDLGMLNNEQIGLISSVSGGAWAAASYVYRENQYINEEFLGTGVTNFNKLLWDSVEPSIYNLSYIPEGNMGIIPTQTYFDDLIESAIRLKLAYGYNWSDIWARIVGERILEPFGLNPIDEFGSPDSYIGDHPNWIRRNVAGIPEEEFQVIHDETAPPLVINCALFSDLENRSHELIPFEINGVKTGLSATVTEGGFTFGGGFSNAYGFASTEPGKAKRNTVKAKLQKSSLADAAGISSAFFATALADKFRAKLKANDWRSKLDAEGDMTPVMLELLARQRERWLQDLEKESTVIPIYPYWSVASAQSGNAEAHDFYFADGGNLENTGVATLVSKGYDRILSFINSQGALAMESSEGTEILSVKDNLAALFGYTPMLELNGDGEKKYYRYDELSESQFNQLDKTLKPYYYNQIFAAEDFEILLDGLYQANADEDGLGAKAAVFTQTLTTVENKKFFVREGKTVQVTWFYLTPASDWNEQLKGHVRQKMEYEYSNFPNYDTIEDIGMEPQQINLLAHFTYWMVMNSGIQ